MVTWVRSHDNSVGSVACELDLMSATVYDRLEWVLGSFQTHVTIEVPSLVRSLLKTALLEHLRTPHDHLRDR